MDKVFAVAGVSTLDGVVKARFAKDLGRVKVLEKNGHTDVRLIELPKAMDKLAAVAFLAAHVDFQDAAAQSALKSEATATDAPRAKAARVPKVKTVEMPIKRVAKSTAEVERIKAKNLETIRKVGKTWQETRDTVGEDMLAEAEATLDALSEAGVPDYRWARIDD